LPWFSSTAGNLACRAVRANFRLGLWVLASWADVAIQLPRTILPLPGWPICAGCITTDGFGFSSHTTKEITTTRLLSSSTFSAKTYDMFVTSATPKKSRNEKTHNSGLIN
jgi:hypothetical protein